MSCAAYSLFKHAVHTQAHAHFFSTFFSRSSVIVCVAESRVREKFRQRASRLVAHWTALVLDERKEKKKEEEEEGDHTLTPAGCGDSPADRSHARGCTQCTTGCFCFGEQTRNENRRKLT
ncbi:Hypothetical predicted protein [Xyrichtys novacula]|uniref:Uncharacterized protein n=1 Tax=Xyrichtys novacula TaxID=13765 RepID=A0AAV1H8L5_XYRNO|nr:Hypothetical predicted protein [Xyrichtys novacula]